MATAFPVRTVYPRARPGLSQLCSPSRPNTGGLTVERGWVARLRLHPPEIPIHPDLGMEPYLEVGSLHM